MADLISLDQCQPLVGEGSVQKQLGGVFTPLKLEHWESLLTSHPDKEYVNYLLKGIREGFRIGFKEAGSSLIGP